MSLATTGGDWVIWALVAASIAAVAAIIDRFRLLKGEVLALQALRGPFLKALSDGDVEAVQKALDAHPGSASRVLREASDYLGRGPEALGDHLLAALSDERRVLEKHMLLLGTLGNNAPFIGLFGTVLGVIKAFHDLAQSGAGPEIVMAGLSEALVATAVGLLVALPCVFAFNFLSKRVKDLIGETEALGRRLGALSHADGKRR